jgi:hypothetical protein
MNNHTQTDKHSTSHLHKISILYRPRIEPPAQQADSTSCMQHMHAPWRGRIWGTEPALAAVVEASCDLGCLALSEYLRSNKNLFRINLHVRFFCFVG